MLIRPEEDRDHQAVWTVNASAFETTAEADLVATLREQATPLISIVAEEAGSIVGHILFSPMTPKDHSDLRILGLAPMAVLPAFQRKGIGSALVRAGLDACRDLGIGAVLVLGHPAFYPRFGFTPADSFGIACAYDAPKEAFMAVELVDGYLRAAKGIIKYHSAFDDL